MRIWVKKTDQIRSDQGRDGSLRHFSTTKVSLQLVGEIALLLVVGMFFVYMLVESFGWTRGSRFLPQIIASFGLLLWMAETITLIWRRSKDSTRSVPSRIMDTGFDIGSEASGVGIRFVRIMGWTCLLYLGIWVLGFHFALPVGVALYLYIYGEVGLVWSLLGGLLFLCGILLLGGFVSILWHEPMVFRLLGFP